MKKHIILTSLVAVGVLTNITSAEAVETGFNEFIVNLENRGAEPDLASYIFQSPDGSNSNLGDVEDLNDYLDEYDAYVAETSANGTTIQLNGIELNVAQGTVSAANYQYWYTDANGDSDWRDGNSAPELLEKDVELSFGSVMVNAGMENAPTIDMGNEIDGWAYEQGEWHLTVTTGGVPQLNGSDVTTDQERTAYGELMAAYEADQAKLADALTELKGYQDANETNFGDVDAVVDADNQSIQDIISRKDNYQAQVSAYNLANSTYAQYEGSAAQAVNNSIETTIASINGTIHGLISEESAANGETTNGRAYNGNLAIGTTVEDHLLALDSAIGNRATLHGEHVQAGADVVTNLQTLNDGIEAETAERIAADNALINKINNADKRVDKVEKDMSAGVASAVALSSVAVSDVKKGEVSVGGGYGYYNSQSALALGAAMGLTDNWSVNAGAGLGTSGSNVSFRAGTNYKFKLF